MKKLISLALALVLVLSLSTVAFADEGDAATFELTKDYQVYGNAEIMPLPDETLSFTATVVGADADAPTVTLDSINPGKDSVNEDGTFTINGHVNGLKKVGEWKYEIKESAVTSQGANHAEGKDVAYVTVYVTRDDDGNLHAIAGAAKDENGNKQDTITNEYSLGHMSVKKEVSGNLGDRDNTYFDIDVTFTSDAPVKSNITVSDSKDDELTVINYSEFTESEGKYTVTKTIHVKHGQTVNFTNIPVGVTYTVAESDKHIGGAIDPNNYSTGYTVTYDEQNGTITKGETQEAVVKNKKNLEESTGIVLDSMPYILLLTLAAAGMFVLLTKKRAKEY